MKKTIRLFITGLLFLTVSNTNAQELPFIKEGDETSKDIRLDKLNISVFVVENIATTTLEMSFYNGTNSVKEGELNFPISQGVTVSRFALDVNGEMREGVVVEKAKATQVFESIVSRGVDPGILEQTKGNNFKARVYPIPARGYKRALIAFEQELKSENGEFIYNMPLNLKKELSEFEVNVQVVKRPVFMDTSSKDLININFQEENESYIGKYSANDVKLDSYLKFKMPLPDNTNEVISYQGIVDKVNYFYINTQTKKEVREKVKVNKISLVWDASLSQKNKDIERELKLLDAYFDWNKNTDVEIITFSNVIDNIKSFKVKNSNWSKVKEYIENINYDGGTKLNELDFSKIKAREILFFSNGLSNMSETEIKTSNIPVIAVNSNSTANLNYLSYLVNQTLGTLINLKEIENKEAIKLITNQQKQFIKAEFSDSELFDVISNTNKQALNSFSIAGKMKANSGEIKLHFGFGDEITETKTFTIKKSGGKPDNLVERIWVQKKIAELSLQEEKNTEEIKALGKQFNIVTKNTSLIVLEDIQDYVNNDILPPESLRKEYYRLKKIKKSEAVIIDETRINRIYNKFKDEINWWKNSTPYVGKEKKIGEIKLSTSSENNIANINNRNYATDSIVNTNSNYKTVRGIVKSTEDGEAMPSVTISIKDSNRITTSDFDGKFQIACPNDAKLVFSFMGYTSIEVDVTNQENLDISLSPDAEALDEVVVFGFSSARRSSRSHAVVSVRGSSSVSEENEIMMESEESNDMSPTMLARRKSIFKIKAWESDAKYMKDIKAAKSSELYFTYLELLEKNSNTPSFFFDVSDYMMKNGEKEMALKVISNLAELELESHEILRSLGRKLSEYNFHLEAIYIFEEVLKIRPFEAQSYRDLGLAYADNKEDQKAIEILYKVIQPDSKEIETFQSKGIESIVIKEINNIITKSKNKLDTSFIDKRFLIEMPVDIRIVIDWDANNTDIDLWVLDPLDEKCSYQNKKTKIGGKISNDITTGYGPEEFILRYAPNGTYSVDINYFGSRKQSITGPVTVRAYLFTNYGKETEKKKLITVQIKNENKAVINLGSFEFGD